jgi:hypothetical protein
MVLSFEFIPFRFSPKVFKALRVIKISNDTFGLSEYKRGAIKELEGYLAGGFNRKS